MASVFSNVASSVDMPGERCRWWSEGALPLSTPHKPFQDGTGAQQIMDARPEHSKLAGDLTDIHYGQDASSTAVVFPHARFSKPPPSSVQHATARDVFLWRCKLGHGGSDDTVPY